MIISIYMGFWGIWDVVDMEMGALRNILSRYQNNHCRFYHFTIANVYAGITPVDGACKCILYLDLAKCGNNVTDVAPGHRGGKINNNNGISGDR